MSDDRLEVARYGWFVVYKLIMACDGGPVFVVRDEAEARDRAAFLKESGARKCAQGLHEDHEFTANGKTPPLKKLPSEFKRRRVALPGQKSFIASPKKGGAK